MKKEKKIWSKCGMCIGTPKDDDIIWYSYKEIELKSVRYGDYKDNIDALISKGQAFKTKEALALKMASEEVEYITKRMACELNDRLDWRRFTRLTGKVDEHGFNDCEGLLQWKIWFDKFDDRFYIDTTGDGTVEFNTAYFDRFKDAKKCLDFLKEKYGIEKLTRIWGKRE